MVVFFCAFLALRSEDNKTPFESIEDFEIYKEDELFAGSVSASNAFRIENSIPYRRILDDHYEHGLRMFRERETGVIRLQASVQTGEMKRSCISSEPS